MATINLSQFNLKPSKKYSSYNISICVAEWNNDITDGLLEGALQTLNELGLPKSSVNIHYVPGAFELPTAAQMVIEANSSIDSVICLGCVIQGQTKHFDFVCEGVTQGIKDVSLKYNKPVIFGVLTDNNKQQSLDRSGGKLGNKGVEAAVTAIKMINFQKGLS